MTIQRLGTINQPSQRAARAAEPVASSYVPSFAPTTYVSSNAATVPQASGSQDVANAFGQALQAIGAIAQAFQQPQPGAYYPQQPTYAPQPAYYPQQPVYAPQPVYSQANVPGFLRPATTVASYQPTYPTYPAAPVQQPTTAAQAQIQQMMAQVAAIQAQIQQILANPQGVQAPALPQLPAPTLPQLPALPAVQLPALPPTPAPVLPAAPALPTAPVVTTPAPAPTAAPFNFPSLQAGAQLRVADGTKVKGFAISGDGRINAISGTNLDMTVNASAAFGMVKMTIGIKAVAQPDGTIRLTATELDKAGNAKKSLFDDKLKVVSSGPNELVLQDPTGKPGSIRVGADGSVTLDHPEGHLVLGRM